MDGHRLIDGRSNRNFRLCRYSYLIFVLATTLAFLPMAPCSTTTTMMASVTANELWSSASQEVLVPEDSTLTTVKSTTVLLEQDHLARTDWMTGNPILTMPAVERNIHNISSTSTDSFVLQSDTLSSVSEPETGKTDKSQGQSFQSATTMTILAGKSSSTGCCLMSTTSSASASPSSSWDIGRDLSADAVRMGDDAFFDIRPSLISISNGNTANAPSTPSSDRPHPSIDPVISQAFDSQGNHALDKKAADNSKDLYDTLVSPTPAELAPRTPTSRDVISGSRHSAAAAADVLTAALLSMTGDSQPAADAHKIQNESKLAAGTIAGIALAGVGFAGFVAAALSLAIVRRVRRLKSKSYETQFANDNGGYLDSLQISYISSQTDIMQESGDEMYSLDNDSFLNSLEAMTMVENGWSDDRRCTTV